MGRKRVPGPGDDFVIVQSQCRHIAPARLGDRVDLTVRPTGAGKRSSFTVEIEMARDGQVLTRCSVTYVTVRDARSAPVPGPLRQALQANGQDR
jgi:acyl-CoA thioesterase FadM